MVGMWTSKNVILWLVICNVPILPQVKHSILHHPRVFMPTTSAGTESRAPSLSTPRQRPPDTQLFGLIHSFVCFSPILGPILWFIMDILTTYTWIYYISSCFYHFQRFFYHFQDWNFTIFIWSRGGTYIGVSYFLHIGFAQRKNWTLLEATRSFRTQFCFGTQFTRFLYHEMIWNSSYICLPSHSSSN